MSDVRTMYPRSQCLHTDANVEELSFGLVRVLEYHDMMVVEGVRVLAAEVWTVIDRECFALLADRCGRTKVL